MIHSNTITAVLQWTTPEQLTLVTDELVQRCHEVGILIRIEEEKNHQAEPLWGELDDLYNALEHMLCDLEVPGFEREVFQRDLS